MTGAWQDRPGFNHRTVAGVRKQLGWQAEILHLPNRTGLDGKKYPAAAKLIFTTASSSEGRRAKSLLDSLGEDAPSRPARYKGLAQASQPQGARGVRNPA